MLLCVGCAGVKVSSVSTRDYVTQRRGDVLATGRLSAAADEAIAVLGLEMNGCRKARPACIDDVRRNDGLDDERRLATLSELWLLRALTLERSSPSDAAQRDAMFDAYLQSARYAYAYLFLHGATAQRARLRGSSVAGARLLQLRRAAVDHRAFRALSRHCPHRRQYRLHPGRRLASARRHG
ncbi:hypothetical protein [Bordetella trematum]|uniref:hypothetical protein n=1 Tax=Bordetella trematum TaxID=123899 RepID=UPI003AF355F9